MFSMDKSTRSINERRMNYSTLMLPGPVDLSPEVLAQMSRPLVPHFGDEFNSFFRNLKKSLRNIFRTEGEVWIMPGSGSAALDAGVLNLSGEDYPALICVNGFFGEVLVEMAQAHRVPYMALRVPRGEAIDPEDVRRVLRENPQIKVVYVVYSESSTGIANPVREIGGVTQEFGCLLFVDAVSAVGGMDLDMDGWNIDFCAGASQKCLGGPPGVAICAVGKRAIGHMRSRTDIRGWYTNLRIWDAYEDDPVDPYPVTMPVSLLLALAEGINQIFQEGLDECIKRHEEVSALVRRSLGAMGFRVVGSDLTASRTVTAAFPPEGISPVHVVGHVERHGIRIRGGLGDFGSKIIRMGHMAYVAQERFVVPTLYAIEDALRQLGREIPRGTFLRGQR